MAALFFTIAKEALIIRDKALNLISQRKENKDSFSECLYQIIGVRYSESIARKGLRILEQYLELEGQDDTDLHGKRILAEVDDKGVYRGTILVNLWNMHLKTKEDILVFHGYDPTQWNLIKHTIKSWNIYSKIDKTSNLFSSTLVAEPIQQHMNKQFFFDMFKELKPPKLKDYEYKPGKLLLELPLMDVHLGKFAWREETGVDYDLKVAEQLYKQTVIDILSKQKSLGLKVDKIISPIGQDFYHFDDEKQNTTRGTPQDSDTRWQKMFRKGCELKVWELEHLRAIAPVWCPYVQSNHDYKMSWTLAEWLQAYYRNTNSVEIDTSLMPRKYHQYGKCLIGYSHGDKEKSKIDKLMQAEAPKKWGNSLFREWHLGHLHSESSKEIPGLKIRRISTITAPDRWHVQHGYTSTVRQAQAFVWSKNKGLELIINSNVVVQKSSEVVLKRNTKKKQITIDDKNGSF